MISQAGMTARVRPPPQLRSPLQLLIVAVTLFFVGPISSVSALEARQYAIEISVDVLNSPFALRLNWEPTANARTYTIRKRVFGSTEWGSSIATLGSSASQYTDTAVSSGTAYEYEVQLETTIRGYGGWVFAHGYVLAGGNVAWSDLKGKVVLIVDDVAAASLSSEVAAFQRELLAAGWFPIRRDLTRTATVPEVRNIIRAEYNADPNNVRSVILLGNVPVPYSGNIAPDLHESHRGAWPADVYYAEMNGTWTDSSVNVISGDYPANNNLPGDGKFDQSQIPTAVELEIGRIDFANLPAFSGKSEVDLLRNYLKKNSDFRRRVFTATPRMLIRDNFGDISGDAPAVDAWRHFRQMFGPGAVREVGENDFFPTLQNESFLWSYGGGGGGLTKADTVGTTWDFASQNPRSVFLILHGSYFGDWNTRDNFLRAAIGSQSYTLASIWSGLPHWFMHPMGLGRTIGFCTRISQNNINQYRTYQNFVAQQVHIALIGDPTLENYPVIPPSNLSGAAGGANVNLNWSASSDQNIVGYYVYHSSNPNGPYQRITASPVGTSHAHAIGAGTHHYMVRAVKLERTGSGTFYNFSQGIFTSVTKSSGGSLPVVTISTVDPNAAETGLETATVKLARNVADANPLHIDLLIEGTAQNGTDFRSLAASAQIPAGSTTATISITPLADNLIEGEETLTIEIKPGSAYAIGTAKSALVRIADAPNAPPTATPQDLQVVENSTLPITLTGQDPENQSLSYRILTQPTNGTLTGTPPGVIYNPDANFIGADTFTFVVNDGNRDSDPASINIAVAMGNRPPLAVGAALETLEDVPILITLSASDPNDEPLQFEIVRQTTNGVLNGSSNVFEYLPGANFFGEDSFTFRVRDSQFTSEPALVSLQILATNDAPLVTNMVFNITEDGSVSFTLIAFDAETNALTFTPLAPPVYGTLTGDLPNYIYTPHSNFYGTDELQYVVGDGSATSIVASVTFIVHPTNDLPVGSTRSFQTWEDQYLPIKLSATDVDADPLTFEIIAPPKHGVLVGSPPNLGYVADTNYFGADSFEFVASDGKSISEPASVQIEVIGVNDSPIVAQLEDRTIRKNTTLGPVSFTITDVDDPLIEQSIWLTSANEELVSRQNITVLPGNEQFVLTPRTNATGETTITMNVNDGYALVKMSFKLTITNTPPIAHADVIEREAGTVSINLTDLLYNDSDDDGDNLIVAGVSDSENGRSVQLSTNAVVYYGTGDSGEDRFTYEVEDTSGARSSATVRLTLINKPRIQNISRVGAEVRVTLSGPPDRGFWLLSSLDGTEWEHVQTGLTDTAGHAQVIHRGGGASEHHRFYRIVWP